MSKGNGQANNEAAMAEQLRLEVIKQELSTRSWVAMRDKMKATIEIAEMQVQYDAVVAAQNKKLEEQQAAYKKLMEETIQGAGMHAIKE